MSFGGDPDYTFAPQPGEWKCCYHKSIDQDTGICNDCGKRAAIMIHLEKREPVNGDISFAVEEFEAACDLAIAKLGGANAYNILGQRRERADIIQKVSLQQNAAHQAGVQALNNELGL